MTLSKSARRWSLLFMLVCGALPLLAQTPAHGTLNIRGSAVFGATTIDFRPPAAGTSGAFTVDPYTQAGTFVALAGSTGSIRDLSGPTTSFLTFTADPILIFNLTSIDPGPFGGAQCAVAPAVGQGCSIASGIPYNFVNVASGSTITSSASLHFTGSVAHGLGSSTFTGVLTTQFPVPYQNVLAAMGNGGSVAGSWSAEFAVQAVVP